MDTLAGQFIEYFPSLSGAFLPGSPPVYLFTKPLNWLNFDPNYPKNPKTFGERLRKFRKDRGLSMRELAEELGVTEDTVINWEVRGVRPRREKFEILSRLFSIHHTL